MDVLILSSRREDNPYGDTDETYVFPRSYLPRFEPLTRGEPMLALIYEPRRGGGRQEYVAWGMLAGAPVPRTDGQYEVRYDGKLVPLPRPCPLTDATGRPFEVRLQVAPRRRWGSVLQGQSVRPATLMEAAGILTSGGLLMTSDMSGMSSERTVELVRRSVRDRGFRGQVLSAYAFRCAVTGFAAPASEARALLDAAHLRPVAAAGGDHVRNGLALSAGVHRLFDEGLVAFGYEGGQVRLEVSSVLETLTLDGQGGHLRLETGMALLLPADPRAWPDPDALAWHRSRVFRR
ncbi:hypothetical protein Dcar01_01826 [Deinococcus carri]|uniref:HNH nuclease domain-containing protein n=1 Tax=Deinococcus carri TaxID=1211323 RepID=A0ABP9W8K9_9DEIO